jgi:ATP-dependent Clp protease ATP-binding subunit ClpC
VDEPSRAEAVEILNGLRSKFEEHHGLKITDAAVEAAVDLSLRYLPDFRLPDKAIDLIDQACASARITSLSVRSDAPAEGIGRAEVAAVVAQRCRLPVERLTEDEAQRLLRMEEALRRRVIGQDEAVRAVAEAVRAARAGLKDPHRPIGVFLLAGSTGTGKTELAKALAEFLFDDERRLIRVDMSEYMEKHAVSRLIGAPPGYIGHDDEGQLSGPVRTSPFSVVLFDEVEKAHPDVLDLFLQIFDEGRLTDARGRRVSFSETVIILTSNLGARAEAPAPPIGFSLPETRVAAPAAEPARDAYCQRIMDAVGQTLRPELLNRIQRVVFFYPLDEDAIRRIIDKVLARLRTQLRERDVDVKLTDGAYAVLMREGFDPRFGAREMERAIDRLLVQPLAKALLAGRLAEGTTVRVDAEDGHLLLEDVARTRPAASGS